MNGKLSPPPPPPTTPPPGRGHGLVHGPGPGLGPSAGDDVGTRHVWLDGALVPIEQARIAPDDRGFLLGDGLFETLRAEGGALAFLDRHLARLRAGAAELEIPVALGARSIEAAARAVLAANGLGSAGRVAAVRITLSRGRGARGLLPSPLPAPTLLVTASPFDARPSRPARVIVARERRLSTSTLSRFKTQSALWSVMARREAAAAGADEAIVQNERGGVCGASAGNVFAVIGGRLVTPSEGEGALPGIVRSVVLEIGAALGIPIEARPLSVEELGCGADLAFLTNSLIGLRRIESIDGVPVAPPASRRPAEAPHRSRESLEPPPSSAREIFVALRAEFEDRQAASVSGDDVAPPARSGLAGPGLAPERV